MGELSEKHIESNRLLIAIFYEGPWERVMNWLWYLGDGQTYRDVREGCIRDRLAHVAEGLHQRWVSRHVVHPERIHTRWKRRAAPVPAGEADGEDTP